MSQLRDQARRRRGRRLPDDDAIARFAGTNLPERNDGWLVRRARDMTLESIASIGDDPSVNLTVVAARAQPTGPVPNYPVAIGNDTANAGIACARRPNR